MTGVVWIHRFPNLATYRYRVDMPSQEVAKHNGFKVGINDGDGDIIIFSKPTLADIELAKGYKLEGAKIVADLQDNHFHDKKGEVYLGISEVADSIICATDVMRQIIGQETGKDAVVIGDPYELPEVAPHANGDDLLWFGQHVNFKDLVEVMPQMGTRKLRVVTGPPHVPGTIMWSMENWKHACSLSNIALFPVREGSEYKSSNRLVNAIRQGLFGVCMQHPSYYEFRDLVWVGHFHTGLRWTEAFRDELNDRVKEAQDYVRDRFSPQTIGKQWASYLTSL